MSKKNKTTTKPTSILKKLLILVLAFVLLGSAIFVPIATSEEPNSTLMYVFLGIYLFAFVICLGVIILKHFQKPEE